jgi:hypothetical protein
MWVSKGQGVKYLGLQIDYHLPIGANFDKIMVSLKSKLINWGNKKASLTSIVLVANQIILASIWYIVMLESLDANV